MSWHEFSMPPVYVRYLQVNFSKVPSLGCVYATPDPKELGGLARLSIWQGCYVTLVPLPKEPLDQDPQQR